MSELDQPRNVRAIDPLTISDQQERKAVLAMQATGYFVDNSSAFETTNDMLRRTSIIIGCPATMTYEDLIFVNPLEAGAYVMSSDSAIARQEAIFYIAHRSIEDSLEETIAAIQVMNFEVALTGLQTATRKLGGLYRQLKSEMFAAFRPYFKGVNGYPGPSGLFTAAIPTIDLLSHGGVNLPEQERSRLLMDIDRGLYPRHQAPLLKDLLHRERPQVDMPVSVQRKTITLLNKFRKVHSGSVKKFVPQALNAGAEGSGGITDVTNYLESKRLNLEEGGRDD